jgi:hypothetical protein
MFCAVCQRNLTACICDDIEERLANLRKSPHLDPAMLDRINAERLLAKHEIEEERKKQAK